MTRLTRPILNPIELTLILVGVVAVAFNLGRNNALQMTPRELVPLEQHFGPEHHSEWGEEWIVRDYFNDKRDGVFLDVGAYHHERLSNTYYLETALGWSGIAVEPQVKFADGYKQFRPKTIFLPFFVSDRSHARVTLNVPSNHDNVASTNKDFAESYAETEPVSVTTTTLDAILAEHPIGHIDFLSMDIELAEPAALNGFSIDKHRPALVCIEAHEEVRQQILDYFAAHGYVVLGKYLRADPNNLWFAPVAKTPG